MIRSFTDLGTLGMVRHGSSAEECEITVCKGVKSWKKGLCDKQGRFLTEKVSVGSFGGLARPPIFDNFGISIRRVSLISGTSS